ncbi:MAG: 5-methyltetrahydropteroyltriglutamate--homocysteine methyltransferase [Micromonosporaceae bacterium]|jgi:5-methyltetrahydropteroyltriglutamate--homocysteine methyltransferase|nr:5-methyltetrahydropteroyltriglutamate--homocysteine methyltransferase [Micromonosporaceae bacterium]
MSITTTVLGYPRIGPNRELKKALEAYWSGRLDATGLRDTAAALRTQAWTALKDAGIDQIPSNTFSLYDHVLDAAVAVDAIPARHRDLGLSTLDTYFAMARGTDQATPLEMTKWFDTNYHYLVPELGPDTTFTANPEKMMSELAEADTLGISTRPVLVGPVTLLLLSKASAEAPAGFDPLDLLDALIDTYNELLGALADAGAQWVQLDEPAFVADRTERELAALERAYRRLGESTHRPKLLVASYFGDLGPALPVLLSTPIDGIGLDLVAGTGNLDLLTARSRLREMTVVAGLVDGRNVWRTDPRAAAGTAATLLGLTDRLVVSTSCSLLHAPVDLDAEPALAPRLRERLAFARQKLDEVVWLAHLLGGTASAADAPTWTMPAEWRDDTVRARLEALRPQQRRRAPYPERAAAQAARLALPPLPTTTIGSFPQTDALRMARADLRAGRIDESAYAERMRAEIGDVIKLQERLGLDVLVHGEPERSDMVQYFAEAFDGFAATEHGWVQSYGSRCVRPPILYADVSRPSPITVEWAAYAQSLTGKPVKGMLTGPVTILAWSFVRDDQPLADTAMQVALALRDEAHDLEAAGIRVIQVDEPALRELLPPRRRDHAAYLDWAVESFRTATSGVADSTQVHTHLCYSEFGEVLPAIDALDADVTSIEASRSRMEVLDDLRAIGYARGVGPGVYDIHSPRVPSAEEIADALRRATAAVPADRLWVNPDCGLKTRGYVEVEAALANLVQAAVTVRESVA